MCKLLNELGDNSNRKAQFRTAIALNINGKQYIFEGVCKGEILNKKQGKSGFGYDPIFKSEGLISKDTPSIETGVVSENETVKETIKVDREIKVWVNGDLVNNGYECTANKGQIAIQAEGSEVEFRKILLTPII
jgi:XTP/dITP diphosphohydrolase